MVYTCFACKWRSDKLPRRSFHKFPSNEELKQKWLDIIGKSNAIIGTRTSLCDSHFEEHCFRFGLVKGRKVLKDGSFPNQHLTKSGKKDQTKTKNSAVQIKPQTENNLHTPFVIINDEEKKDSSPESNDQNIIVEVPGNFGLQKSNQLHAQSGKDDILRLKKKVLSLQLLVKRLRNSKREMASEITELKKTVRQHEDDKIIDIHTTKIKLEPEDTEFELQNNDLDPLSINIQEEKYDEKPNITNTDRRNSSASLKEHELFSRSIAQQLTQLPQELAVELQMEIQKIVGEKRLAFIKERKRSLNCC